MERTKGECKVAAVTVPPIAIIPPAQLCLCSVHCWSQMLLYSFLSVLRPWEPKMCSVIPIAG